MNPQTFLANFGHIANAPGGIKRLRDSILHLAVSGRLVPRFDVDGSAEEDVNEAETLKVAYREKLDLRPMVADRPLSESERFYPIPAHWMWVRLGNVACYIQRGKSPKYDTKGRTLVVSQKCIQWSGFDLSLARTISDESVEAYGKERFLVVGDILWNSTGTGTAGRLVEYPGSKEQVVADSHVTVVRFTNFLPAFVRCFLGSPIIQQRMEPGVERTLVTGTTNQVELSNAQVLELPVPCAPVREQKRIVKKVDELMSLCDRLDARQQEQRERFPVLSRACHTRLAENRPRLTSSASSMRSEPLLLAIFAKPFSRLR
jgi:type I restriction enzyme, S subunit